MKTKSIAIALLLAVSAAGQNLTREQKEVDFRYLASIVATYYAPLDWKREVLNVDALDISSWMQRALDSKTDLEFYDVCVEYLAQLQDSHTSLSLPSAFAASLGLTVDIYDGKVLIESINRTLLPATRFPFAVGDELVSVDGEPMEELIPKFAKYAQQGSARATRRLAAQRIVSRFQSNNPFASLVGDAATVVIRRQNEDLETYSLPWSKSGAPLEVGRVPSPKAMPSAVKQASSAARLVSAVDAAEADLAKLADERVTGGDPGSELLNYGARNPVFLSGLGPTFTRRLGGSSADNFYSGYFRHQELTIGYLRIPNYTPASVAAALNQLNTEIAWLRANTDGLILDQMRNPGGDACYAEEVARRLFPDSFHGMGLRLKPLWWRVMLYYNAMIAAREQNLAPEVIQKYENLYQALLDAYQGTRGLTEPVPVCSESIERDTARDFLGRSIAYDKPILMLVDEFSASAADRVAAIFQQNNRGVLYGYRTNGAGGTVIDVQGSPYTETITRMTVGMHSRTDITQRESFPFTRYVENVGVHPEVVDDYMTRENLLKGGAPFVQRFLWAAAAYIRQLRLP